jgi:hypothetical protein
MITLKKLHTIIIYLVLLIIPVSYTIIGQSQPTEYEVRAAFLYNFIKFVKWPRQVFKSSQDPIVIGIIGQDPFGNTLDTMIKERTIQSKKIIIKRYHRHEDVRYCHVLYMGLREKRYQVAILKHLEGIPVLTIGDFEDFTRLGGMIKFIVADNQVGFEINLEAVEKSNLEISAKLLKLAKITNF